MDAHLWEAAAALAILVIAGALFLRLRRPSSAASQPLTIEIGSGSPYESYSRGLDLTDHRIRVGVRNNSAKRRLDNCALSVEQITGDLAQQGPIPIKSGISLDPGETVFVEIAETTEPARHNGVIPGDPPSIEVRFPLNPAQNGRSFLDPGRYDLTLLLTGPRCAPRRSRCRLAMLDGYLSLTKMAPEGS